MGGGLRGFWQEGFSGCIGGTPSEEDLGQLGVLGRDLGSLRSLGTPSQEALGDPRGVWGEDLGVSRVFWGCLRGIWGHRGLGGSRKNSRTPGLDQTGFIGGWSPRHSPPSSRPPQQRHPQPGGAGGEGGRPPTPPQPGRRRFGGCRQQRGMSRQRGAPRNVSRQAGSRRAVR